MHARQYYHPKPKGDHAKRIPMTQKNRQGLPKPHTLQNLVGCSNFDVFSKICCEATLVVLCDWHLLRLPGSARSPSCRPRTGMPRALASSPSASLVAIGIKGTRILVVDFKAITTSKKERTRDMPHWRTGKSWWGQSELGRWKSQKPRSRIKALSQRCCLWHVYSWEHAV